VSLNGLQGTVKVRPLQWGEKGAATGVMDGDDDDDGGDNGDENGDADTSSSNPAATPAASKKWFDLVLCSDLIYGDEEPSRLLVQTLLEVSAKI